MNTRTEVDVLKNLKHTCLPQVFNFVEDNGSVYTVMEFIPGKSFKQYLDARTVFPERSIIIWMKKIAATLAYLHNQNPAVIHSDLKPGNIMRFHTLQAESRNLPEDNRHCPEKYPVLFLNQPEWYH